MQSLKELTTQLDREINHLETDPEQVALKKLLEFVDKDIAGEISERESDDFFKDF
jgi:hypothetical protein